MHFAHFQVAGARGWRNLELETLCGTPGGTSMDIRLVRCGSCRMLLDRAMEEGTLEQIHSEMWVVNGDPIRLPEPDRRDEFEFHFSHYSAELPRPYLGRALKVQPATGLSAWLPEAGSGEFFQFPPPDDDH